MKKALLILLSLCLVVCFAACDMFKPNGPTDEVVEALCDGTHCVCDGTAAGKGEHVSCEEFTWTSVKNADELIAAIDNALSAPAIAF